MLRHFIFLLIAGFWVTMTYLLWRAEFGLKEVGAAVPVESVWNKVLTAPDDSSLDILHHGKKIGYCRWSPNIGDAVSSGKVFTDDYEPEGLVKEVNSYRLEVEGNVNIGSPASNLRFELEMTLSTNQAWQSFRLRASMRPHFWEISANAKDQEVNLFVNDESGVWEHTMPLSDLQNPEKIAREFGGPLAVAMLGTMGLRSAPKQGSKTSIGLNWQARNDWMRFGHSKVRVYRIETKLLERFGIYIFVSRVGEILWVHLPGEVVLSNNAFEHF